MSAPADALDAAISRLAEHYEKTVFYTERDVVWFVQTTMVSLLAEAHSDLRVFNDYKMPNRLRADLAVVDTANAAVLLALEFKYEPDRARDDIPPGKFPVTAWTEIRGDIARAGTYVSSGQAQQAFAVLIDEDGRYDFAAAQSFSAEIDLGKAGAAGSAATGWINESPEPASQGLSAASWSRTRR